LIQLELPAVVIQTPRGGWAVDESAIAGILVGVSAGLAGLVLVFLGLIVGTYQSFDADTPAKVLTPYRRAVGFVVVAFLIGILCVSLATVTLVSRGANHSLYLVSLWLFAAQLVSLVGATMWTVAGLVWRR
jgi:hypothetical protein